MLHRVVREHLEAFLAAAAARTDGAGMPPFIEREFREFLVASEKATFVDPHVSHRTVGDFAAMLGDEQHGLWRRDSRVAIRVGIGHIGLMRTTTLATAKATLSALVSEAQHRGRRTVILRHGKASAAIVPVDVATGTAGRPRAMSDAEAKRLLAGFGKASRRRSAVVDLLSSRR